MQTPGQSAFFKPKSQFGLAAKSAKKKALVMCLSSADQGEFNLLGDTLRELKDCQVEPRKTNAAEFSAGSKKTTFDFVLAPLFNMDGNFSDGDFTKFTEAKEFYENYGKAPIFIFVAAQMPEEGVWKLLLKDTVKNSELIMVDGESRQDRARAMLAGYQQALAKYDNLREKVVEPQFRRYDEDGSGAIDKEELSKLCTTLGQPLDDSQLESAIKDLDINKDGVIDLDEFCAWWFSGFQSYSTYKRTMLKLQGRSRSAFQALMKGDVESIIGSRDQMKQIKHSLTFSFNKPEKNPKSSASIELHPGGKTSTHIYNELHSRFKNTTKFDMRRYAEENDCSVNDAFDIYVQVKIKMKKGFDKKLFGQKIEAAFQDLQEKNNTDKAEWLKRTDIWSVKCKIEGDSLCIGKHILLPHKYVNDKTDFFGDEHADKGVDWYFEAVEILEQISEIDQSVKVKLDLGTSARDFMNSKNSPYSEFCKGFSLTTSVELIRNLKKIIFGLLSDKEDSSQIPKRMKKALMGVSPLVLLKMNANINLTHDSIQELKECCEQSETLKHLTGTLDKLYKSDDFPDFQLLRAKKLDETKFKDEDLKQYESCFEAYQDTVLTNLAIDIFSNMAEQGDIQVSAAFPKLGAMLFKIKSEGLGEMLNKLGAELAKTELKARYEEWCPTVYDEKSPLGKAGSNYMRKLRTVNGKDKDISDGGFMILNFEEDGYFSCSTDYTSSDEFAHHYPSWQVHSFGAWKTEGQAFTAPDKSFWKKWEDGHTIYWTERYSVDQDFFYSGKFEDGKIVGTYYGDEDSYGTFTIQKSGQEDEQNQEAVEDVRENLLLEYFPLRERAISIRLLLYLCEVDYEDRPLAEEAFDAEKYPFGYAIYGKDGNNLTDEPQSDAYLKFLGKTYKKDGQSLYQDASDPEFSQKIDALLENQEDLNSKIGFFYSLKLGSDKYQDQFAKFLTQHFPSWLKKLEDTLKENRKTYLLRDEVSLPDLSAADVFIAFPYNPNFELCHILQCVMEKYPKVKAYAEQLLKDFKPWMDKNKLPKPNIESQSKMQKRTIYELVEEIKNKNLGSINLLKNYRNEEVLQELIGFTPDKIPYKNEEIPVSKIQVKFQDGNGAENLLNNDCVKQWTCETFKSGETRLNFTFSEPQQLHFYSFTTAFLDAANKAAKYSPTTWDVTLTDHKTKEEYKETHYSWMHKFGTNDQKKYLSLTKERFQFLKFVTTSEVTFTFSGSSGRAAMPDEDLHLEFENQDNGGPYSQMSKAYQRERTKATKFIYVPYDGRSVSAGSQNASDGGDGEKPGGEDDVKEDGEGEFQGEGGYPSLKGTFKDGYLEGQGTETYEDGFYYEGNFENGFREGEGTYSWQYGYNKYEGSWKKGKMHGHGTLELYVNYSKFTYTGEFVDGKFEGEGEIYLGESPYQKYTGAFKDGKQHGHASIELLGEENAYEINTFEGEWKDGKRVHFFVSNENNNENQGEDDKQPQKTDKNNQQKEIDKSSILEDLVPNKIQINRIQFFGPKGAPVKVDQVNREKESKTFEDDDTEDALATYDGEWATGWGSKTRDGLGVCKWENGKFFEGLWSNDKIVKGRMHKPEEGYTSKYDYEGEFKGYKLGGYGKLNYGWNFYGYCTGETETEKFGTTFTDSNVVVSEIKNNYYNGKGVYYSEGTSKNVAFVGHFNDGYWSGYGYGSNSEDLIVLGDWYNNSLYSVGITAYANGDFVIGKIASAYYLDYDITHEDYCIKYEAATETITQGNQNSEGFHGLGIIRDKNGVSKKAMWENGELKEFIEEGDINTLIRCHWQLGTTFDAKYLDPFNFNDSFWPEKDENGDSDFETQLHDLCKYLKIKTTSE